MTRKEEILQAADKYIHKRIYEDECGQTGDTFPAFIEGAEWADETVIAKIEKLKEQLIRGACSSQIAMETSCKEEAYNEVLAILNSLQEESTNDNMHDKYKRITQSNIFKEVYNNKSLGETIPVDSEIQEIVNEHFWEMLGEESISEDLEKAAKDYATQVDCFGNKTIAGNEADAFKAGANWQKQKDAISAKDLDKAAKEWLNDYVKNYIITDEDGKYIGIDKALVKDLRKAMEE